MAPAILEVRSKSKKQTLSLAEAKHAAFENYAKQITSGVELVTPEVATGYLKLKARNRKITPKRVAAYAKLMREGKWKLSPQGIDFNAQGELINGQNRLTAIVESGVSVYMMVTRNWDNSVMLVLDTGQSRTVSQTLQIAGNESATNARIAIMRAMFLTPGWVPTSEFAPYQDREYLAQLYDKHENALELASWRAKHSGGISSAVVRSVLARAYYHVNPDSIQNFIRVLDTGLPVRDGQLDSAALLLRNYFITTNFRSDHDRLLLYEKSVWAFQQFVEQRPVSTRLGRAKTQPYPVSDFDTKGKVDL